MQAQPWAGATRSRATVLVQEEPAARDGDNAGGRMRQEAVLPPSAELLFNNYITD